MAAFQRVEESIPMPKLKELAHRGHIPGRRGPALTPAEREAKEQAAKQRQLRALERGRANRLQMSPGPLGVPKSRDASKLAELIQSIGNETIDPTQGWTRIEAVIRRVYADALSGKTAAQDLLFNRGWGRVPLPMKIDVRAELTAVLEQSGLTLEDAANDPLLKHLLEGPIIDNDPTIGQSARPVE